MKKMVHSGSSPSCGQEPHTSAEPSAQDLIRMMRNGMLVILDGRNEHGSHVLAAYPTFLPMSDDDLAEDAETIIRAAEALGYSVGDCVWARFIFCREEYHHGHWEFDRIVPEVTDLLAAAGEGWVQQ